MSDQSYSCLFRVKDLLKRNKDSIIEEPTKSKPYLNSTMSHQRSRTKLSNSSSFLLKTESADERRSYKQLMDDPLKVKLQNTFNYCVEGQNKFENRKVSQQKKRVIDPWEPEKLQQYQAFSSAIKGRERTYLNFVISTFELKESQKIKNFAKTQNTKNLFLLGDSWTPKQVSQYMHNERFTKEQTILQRLTQKYQVSQKQELSKKHKSLNNNQSLIQNVYSRAKMVPRLQRVGTQSTIFSQSSNKQQINNLFEEINQLHLENLQVYEEIEEKRKIFKKS